MDLVTPISEVLPLVLLALMGTLVASTLALVPALHVYNVAALVLVAAAAFPDMLSGDRLAMLLLGMVTGYAMLNAIPSLFFGAPDDSTVFLLLPGQKYMLMSRGYEAVVLTGLGGLGGIIVLLALAPFAQVVFGTLRALLIPHLAWILAIIIVYMLFAEWPKGGDRGATRRARFWDAWRGLLAGILTFLLSGLLGLILMYRSPVPLELAFQNLLPAFVGLFGVPWLLENIASGAKIPRQIIPSSVDAPPGLVVRGVMAGAVGGLFAAFFPVVTAGVGGYLAGQATAQRDDRVFIISQGACKLLYYVGAVLLFFLPATRVVKGGLAGMLATVYAPAGASIYPTAIAVIALCGALSFFLLLAYARVAIWFVGRVSYRRICAASLVVLSVLVGALTGLGGLGVMLAATPIGLLPVLWGSRRLNCLGVILLPITLNLTGAGPILAQWLGLS